MRDLYQFSPLGLFTRWGGSELYLRVCGIVASSLVLLCLVQGCVNGDIDDSRPSLERSPAMPRMSQEQILDFIRSWQEQREQAEFSYPLLPPWRVAPEYPMGSMGWRMGSGEDYWFLFGDWFKGLSASEQEAYILENPEPDNWEGFYDRLVGKNIDR